MCWANGADLCRIEGIASGEFVLTAHFIAGPHGPPTARLRVSPPCRPIFALKLSRVAALFETHTDVSASGT